MYDHRLKIFITVAECGSFSKAAKELYITQPAVTKQIISLEKYLGFQLFKRNHTGVVLTEAGAAFYEEARKIIQYSTTAVSRARDIAATNKKVIRIGCYSSVRNLAAYLLPPILSKRRPDLEIQLVEHPGKLSHDSIVRGIQGDAFDVVEFGYNHRMKMDGLSFAKIYQINVSFEIPTNNPLVNKDKLTIEDLAGQKFCIPPRGNCVSFDQMRDKIQQEVPSASIIDDDTDSTMMAKCQSEGNILVLFHRQIDHFDPLISIAPPWEIPLDIGLVYRTDAEPHIIEFVELAKRVINEVSLEAWV